MAIAVVLGAVKSLYDLFRTVGDYFDPDPTVQDLIERAKTEILNELEDIVSHEYIAQVNALFEAYNLYLVNPTEGRLNFLDSQSLLTLHYCTESVRTGTPRLACKVAQAFNLIAPLRGIIMRLMGDSDPQTVEMLESAIDVNKCLIGQYRFTDLPNVPIYHDPLSEARIPQCYHAGEITYAEFDEIVDFVWKCNEELRALVMSGYPDGMRYIVAGGTDSAAPCMHAQGSEVHFRPLPSAIDSSYLWKLEFERYNSVKFISVDNGLALTFVPLEQDPDSGWVALTSGGNQAATHWHFLAWTTPAAGAGIGTNARANAYLFNDGTVFRIYYVLPGQALFWFRPFTCAVTEVLSQASMTTELHVLRRFRDLVLQPSRVGRFYALAAQTFAPEILRVLAQDKALLDGALTLSRRLAQVAAASLTKAPEALSPEDVEALSSFLQTAQRRSSPQLAELICRTLSELPTWSGKSPAEALAALDRAAFRSARLLRTRGESPDK